MLRVAVAEVVYCNDISGWQIVRLHCVFMKSKFECCIEISDNYVKDEDIRPDHLIQDE